MFKIDVDLIDKRRVIFPTFEEAIGILDLAISRNEYIKDYDLENITPNSNRIRQLRVYLVLLMAQIIHEKLRISGRLHNNLISKLKENGQHNRTMFLTSNYNILIDNAITRLMSTNLEVTLDYGIDFTNFKETNDWKKPKAGGV